MLTDDRTSARQTGRLRARDTAVSPARGANVEAHPCRVYSVLAVDRHPAPPMASRRHSGSVRAFAAGSLAVVGALAGGLGGCAPDEEPPLPPVVWEGETVRVRMDDPEVEVCGGSFEALDRHAELVREELLLEGDGMIEYSIGDVEFVDEWCSADSPIACTRTTTGVVFTTEPFIPHEIVHAVRVLDPRITRLRSSPFEEGLATLLGSNDLPEGSVPLDAIGILEDADVGGAAEYFRAGYSMALLIERHGVDLFRNFDLLARDRAEDRAFEEVFGETKAEFAAVADEAPLCDQSQWWVPLLECDGEPTTADPANGGLSFSGDLRCGDERTLGPEDGRMWTTRHFRLDEQAIWIGYRFEMPDDATLEIVSCDSGCPERFAYIGTRYEVGSIANGLPSLEPGEYFLRMSRPVSENDDGWFEIVLK